MDLELQTVRAAFVSCEKVPIKDSSTGKEVILYKTYFLTSDKKMLTYWLTSPTNIEVELPACDIVLEQRVSNAGKFELKVKEVLVV